MKLRELIPLLVYDINHELKLTSIGGHRYSLDNYKTNQDKFLERQVFEIVIRNNEIKVSLLPLKEENNE